MYEKLTYARILYDYCPKNARILHNNCPKNIFPEFFFFFWGGGGRAPLCTPSPTPVAKFGENIYDRAILTLWLHFPVKHFWLWTVTFISQKLKVFFTFLILNTCAIFRENRTFREITDEWANQRTNQQTGAWWRPWSRYERSKWGGPSLLSPWESGGITSSPENFFKSLEILNAISCDLVHNNLMLQVPI